MSDLLLSISPTSPIPALFLLLHLVGRQLERALVPLATVAHIEGAGSWTGLGGCSAGDLAVSGRNTALWLRVLHDVTGAVASCCSSIF